MGTTAWRRIAGFNVEHTNTCTHLSSLDMGINRIIIPDEAAAVRDYI